MNAIELVTTGANELAFKNRALQNATMKIVRLTEKVKGNMYEIARIIAQVDETECYKDDGFDSVHAWTYNALGYKKSMSYDLLKIGKEYTREITTENGKITGYECNLLPEGSKDNFSTTQVLRMLPAGREIVAEMVGDEIIVPSMTSKEIRKAINQRLHPEEAENENSPEMGERPTETENKSFDLSKVSTSELIAELEKRGYHIEENA